jgi:endonuclease/exonuclease/phosphatase family metal-dependent hydrolase
VARAVNRGSAARVSMEVSYRLQVVGQQPTRDAVLPELPGSSGYSPSLLDRFGEQLQRSWPLIALGTIGGAVGGATLLRGAAGGMLRTIAGGAAGAIGGSLLTGSLLGALRSGDHAKPRSVREGEVASPTPVADEQLRVMTYNVHGGTGGPGGMFTSEAELDALEEAIRREDPDVLLLQEVDRFAARSNYTDLLRELSDRLGADSAVGASAVTNVTGRDQHVAVMTFNGNTISDARNIVHQDPRGGGVGVRFGSFLRDAKAGVGSIVGKDWGSGERGYEVRNTIDTLIRTPAGNAVRFLSGHYEWPSEHVDHQQRQVGAVAGALDAWDGPTIWGADFNVRTASDWGAKEVRIMGDAGLRDAFDAVPEAERLPIPERSTHPERATDSDGGIDRVYVSDQFDVDRAYVARDAGDASDHLPVVADVRLRTSRPD